MFPAPRHRDLVPSDPAYPGPVLLVRGGFRQPAHGRHALRRRRHAEGART